MGTLMAAVLALLAAPQEDAAGLIRQLGSESIEKRDEATRKLKELGKGALEDLKKAAEDKDAEVATRARHLIAVLEVREKMTARLLEAMPGRLPYAMMPP